MSQENVELIRRAYDAMNSGDLEAAKAIADPNIELQTPITRVAGRVYRGLAGVDDWFADVGEAWDGVEQIVERFIEVSAETTIAMVRFTARGKASGVQVAQELASIWTIRNHKVVTVETYPTLDEASAAAGFSG
jgi:ketosteroid isomerase-like protein